MTTNYLYINTTKTTLINITNNIFHFPTIYFENTALIPHNSTTYLGVAITDYLTMTAHINNITKTATTHLIQLFEIRKSLTSKTVYLLANALIFVRLDYCSTLLINSTKQQLQELNRIIKSTTRPFLINANTIHVLSSLIFSLNISPIEILIKTRLINIIHTVLYESLNLTHYLTDLLHFKPNLRSLRNSNTYLLTIPNLDRNKTRWKIIQIFGHSYPEQSTLQNKSKSCTFKKRIHQLLQ